MSERSEIYDVIEKNCFIRPVDDKIYVPSTALLGFLSCGIYRELKELVSAHSGNPPFPGRAFARNMLLAETVDDLWQIWGSFFRLADRSDIHADISVHTSRSASARISLVTVDVVIELGIEDAIRAYFDGVPLEDVLA